MITLNSEQNNIHIDERGFIAAWNNSHIDVAQPTYIVFFQDYSRPDPSCRLWDTSAVIENVLYSDKHIQYTKKIESLTLNCVITVGSDGWNWDMRISGNYPLSHFLGLALPGCSPPLYCLDKHIQTPMAQYYRSSQEVFRDQTFMELPTIYSQSSQITVFTSIENDCQFFHYNDNVPYIRMSSSTTMTNSISVWCSFAETHEQAQAIYVQQCPATEKYIYSWKPKLKKIAQNQDVEITYYPQDIRIEEPTKEIVAKAPTDRDLKIFSTILQGELSKYPPKLLKLIGIDGIILCRDLNVKSLGTNKLGTRPTLIGRCNGIAMQSEKTMSWIICDARLSQDWLIHHEIFHYLCHHLDLSQYPEEGASWLDGIVDIPIEQQCDLFASIMTHRDNWSSTDYRVQQTIELKRALLHFNENFLDIIPAQPRKTVEIIWHHRKGKSTEIVFGEMPHDVDYHSSFSDRRP